ncbi:hypothetical protein Q5P01_000651 [Channa striata]|uniref:Uncharacterized protein n=1 Tax=Channa striata TaxID=64152 RepID=A0AA88III1_CHASR|nr:hypothetical protein Q5P01_000651 [Channa striata]
MLEIRIADLERQLEEQMGRAFAEAIQLCETLAPEKSGKDLVQEVAKLRRSLDAAEGVSRDAEKEWAVLRSVNMALKEFN